MILMPAGTSIGRWGGPPDAQMSTLCCRGLLSRRCSISGQQQIMGTGQPQMQLPLLSACQTAQRPMQSALL